MRYNQQWKPSTQHLGVRRVLGQILQRSERNQSLGIIRVTPLCRGEITLANCLEPLKERQAKCLALPRSYTSLLAIVCSNTPLYSRHYTQGGALTNVRLSAALEAFVSSSFEGVCSVLDSHLSPSLMSRNFRGYRVRLRYGVLLFTHWAWAYSFRKTE